MGGAIFVGRNVVSARNVLWLHTLVMGVAGLIFFVYPKESATLWPWQLPPLAARFMGSLFLGGAACSLACLRSRDDRGLFAMALLAVGDMLIALTALPVLIDTGVTPRVIWFLVFFVGIALLLILKLLPTARGAANPQGMPVTRALRGFFVIHLIVVLPVGLSMYFVPAWAQPLWPWQMTPVNVRLIGSFFFGAALISMWALRQPCEESLRPVLALYAFFASMATIASVIHLGLFNPARIATWAFFALYVFVAGGSWLLWLQAPKARAVSQNPQREVPSESRSG